MTARATTPRSASSWRSTWRSLPRSCGSSSEHDLVEVGRRAHDVGRRRGVGRIVVEEGVHQRRQLALPPGVAGLAAAADQVRHGDDDEQDDDQGGHPRSGQEGEPDGNGHPPTLPGGRAAVTRLTSSRVLNGLATKSVAPAAKPRSRSGSWALAVSSSTGVRASAGSSSERRARQTSRPFIRGIIQSRTTRSGRSCAGRGQTGLPVGLHGDLQTEPAEPEGDEVGDDGIVVDDEHVGHGAPIRDRSGTTGIGTSRR